MRTIAGGRPDPPRPPDGLLAETIESWSAFWGSPLAEFVMPAHVPTLTHLWRLYDERTRCYRQLRQRGRLTKGSTGQPVRSPLYDVIRLLNGEITQLEDRFGLSPRAAQRLGVGSGDAGRSLEDLNAALEADAGEQPDPRALAALDGGA